MFSRIDQLIKKTGENGIGRFDFLKLLTEEYQKSTVYESKRQVLANLANFAYDPINFEFIRELRITEIFLAQLSENQEELLNFALAGLCNLSLDPECREYIINYNGIFLISEQLLHRNEDIALNALTTLIFLITPESIESITSPPIVNKVLHYLNSSDSRFKNLANIFLQDYCSKDKIDLAQKEANLKTHDIPLPFP